MSSPVDKNGDVGGNKQKKWMPNMLIWEWQENEGAPLICSIVINLPSGVLNNNLNFSVAVSENCLGLDVEMTWPSFLMNIMEIHKWAKSKLPCYHP